MTAILYKRNIWIIRAILALAALLLVGWKFGFQILDPTHDSWLYFLGSDITPDYFAWIWYRDTPWQWPLGVIQNYSFPVRTSVGLTGGIPLLAVPFKLLSPILPETFQYHGWWLYMNYVLQGWAGVFLLRILKIKHPVLLLLGGAFFILSPPFLDRHPHANLTAHWLILYALGTALASIDQISVKRKIWTYAGLSFAAVWIHPYLVPFPLAFSFADLAGCWLAYRSRLKLKVLLLWPFATIAGVLVAYFSIGYNMLPSKGALSSGFGQFSANLNTFFNSMDRMEIIPGLPLAFPDHQYEGFGYLGAGMIILLIAAFFLLVWKRPFITSKTRLHVLPVILAVFGFFILSLSNVITFHDHVLFEIPLSKDLQRLGSTFRASGRYIWAAHYLIFGLTIWFLARRLKQPYLFVPALAAALLIQFIDVKPYIPSKDIYPHGPFDSILKSEAWEPLFDEARLVVMEPAYERNFAMFGDDMYFIRLAHKTKTPITAGHLARYDNAARNLMRDSIKTMQESGQLLPTFEKALFVTIPTEANRFEKLAGNGELAAYLTDGYVLYVPQKLGLEKEHLLAPLTPLRGKRVSPKDFLETHKKGWVLVSVKDEASRALCDEVKDYVKDKGGKLHSLGNRMPYMAVWHNGAVLWDSVYTAESRFTQVFNQGQILGGDTIPATISITSGGGDQRACNIIANGVDYAINERGLNMAAFDSSFQFVEKEWFDTWQQCAKWKIGPVEE